VVQRLGLRELSHMLKLVGVIMLDIALRIPTQLG
jgi:hypothetical protein